MFEILSDKLSSVFRRLRSRGRLTEKDIDEGLREIRLALLEADVNFRVVKDFTARVRERSIGEEVLQSLTPAQQIIKIVNEELIAILGSEQSHLAVSAHPPSVAMLVGLQGSGKTTTAAKLALHLRHSGQRPLLVVLTTLTGSQKVGDSNPSSSTRGAFPHSLSDSRSCSCLFRHNLGPLYPCLFRSE